MSMTDPISDFLTRIRNALMAKHATVAIPSSKVKIALARILDEEGYISGYDNATDDRQGVLTIELKYAKDGTPAISGLERVSRPGRRVYRGKAEIPRVLNGLGVTVVSTSAGLMTGVACRARGVGGEVLCNVW